MTKFLYWLVLNCDLGPLGPKLLDLAVQSWLRGARRNAAQPYVRRRRFGWLITFHLQPLLGGDERM